MTKKEKMRLLRKHTGSDSLSRRLFYKRTDYYQPNFSDTWKMGIDNLDDECGSYKDFLDNVQNKEDLVLGLTELRPFADDALKVAIQMTDFDFINFKLALVCERQGKDSKMSTAYRTIVLPARILQAMIIADKARAPVGSVLVRILKRELGV